MSDNLSHLTIDTTIAAEYGATAIAAFIISRQLKNT